MSSNARSGQWQTAAHPGPAALRGNLGVALAQAQPAPGPGGAWRRGWVLTAMGRFGPAWEELAGAGAVDEPYGAAAAVTRGALLRQVGLHRRAEEEDAAVAASAPAGTEIAAAALIGLVADHVGQQADPAELDRRLAVAGRAVAATASPRQRIRIAWAAGEVAMAGGGSTAWPKDVSPRRRTRRR